VTINSRITMAPDVKDGRSKATKTVAKEMLRKEINGEIKLDMTTRMYYVNLVGSKYNPTEKLERKLAKLKKQLQQIQ
jgi:hypothetical protein